jgi:hypothetical protein
MGCFRKEPLAESSYCLFIFAPATLPERPILFMGLGRLKIHLGPIGSGWIFSFTKIIAEVATNARMM